MDIYELAIRERTHTGTAWTLNEDFDRDGYLVIKNLWDPKALYTPVPGERGKIDYFDNSINNFKHEPLEGQVNGSLGRYGYPKYREIHSQVRLKIEEKIGRPLYNTYYAERFYFSGQELKMHVDRPSCEISLTVHISTNLTDGNEKWPFWIKTPDIYSNKKKEKVLVPGEDRKLILEPGDGVIYKGCERPHWRGPMPGASPSKEPSDKEEELYYHQIFFHYVLQDGQRAHYAFDAAK